MLVCWPASTTERRLKVCLFRRFWILLCWFKALKNLEHLGLEELEALSFTGLEKLEALDGLARVEDLEVVGIWV